MTYALDVPELKSYQDEPKQLPCGSPGKVPFLRLGFEKRGERSVLVDLQRRAPLLVQRALYWDEQMPDMPCVFIMSSSGGILQGDRVTIEIALSAGAEAHVTTQAATKIHEMDTNYATQIQDIVLGEHAYLEYLPDPIIPFKHSRFVSKTRLSVDASATLLYSEILMPGRKYYENGEIFEYDLFSSTVGAERPGNEKLFTEKFIVRPFSDCIRRNGVMNTFDVFANVLFLTPKKHADIIFARVASEANLGEQLAAGVSYLPNNAGLIYKVLGMESEPVKLKVREFWKLVRQEVAGKLVPDEFIWR